ncbi:hypothetical protein [Rubrivirga marina]|uniref:Uncharacterized protein n=1 Tax=Rubrivirga marina TaxID=1196024 RepID=A0A271J329_9BACT|nr:hypothetical protein [Rubrivirga marina]PAP77119.1 hypothetical protein BSZ37_12125 [Rubrivirga marina]
MPRTPHSRTRPPAPKERPTSLATSGAPLVTPPRPPSDTKGGRPGDIVGFWAFTLLIVLGLIAAARAFLTM